MNERLKFAGSQLSIHPKAATNQDVTGSETVPESESPLFPDNVQFWFETGRAFGATSYGASEFGEVLATSARIRSGSYDSWYEEWNRTAERVAREAANQLDRSHPISARDSYLREIPCA